MGSMKGSQKTETSVPRFVEDGGRFGVDRAKDLAQMGYMPYFGPDVAALTPMQQASMQNTNQAANAFGMQSANVGMPQAQDYGGFSAYSSAPMFTGAQDQLQQRMPGLFEAYSNMFIDPQTGTMGGARPNAQSNNSMSDAESDALADWTERLRRAQFGQR